MRFADITFANPQFLWLLILLPVLVFIRYRINKVKRTEIVFPTTGDLLNVKPTLRQRLLWLPLFLRLTVLGLLIVALARPRSSSKGTNVTSEGIAIVMAMDVSSSMLAEDLKPNRIEASKRVASAFIQDRSRDVIGLVVFSGESFTQCPITSDHSVLLNLMSDMKSGLLEDGTAIGEGLATAIARIKDSPAKSKVIILLTDGVNNSGSIAPITAGEIARTFGIRVYTIGVGRNGLAPYPFKTPFGIQYQNIEVQIDEDILQQISDATDAKYFRATDNDKLKSIYEEIDKMERTKIEITEFKRYTEEYLPYAIAALVCLMLEILLRYTLLKKLP